MMPCKCIRVCAGAQGRLPSGDAVVSSLGSRGESSTDLSEHLCGGLETMSARRRRGRESYDVAT